MNKIWVNGTFDVLHVGHIELLEYASNLGIVRVGIDSDRRVKEKKGKSRPFNNLSDRIKLLSSIKYVHSVVSFDTDDELANLIKDYDSDYMVIGDDYTGKNIIGSEFVKEIIFFKRIKDKSTTNILDYGKNISDR